MPPAPPRPSPSGLTVLALLSAGPLHPYGMQRLIKTWGKDQVVNIGQRANLYKTIRRLHEAGLIAVRQTERDQQYPERTVYELTDEGRRAGMRWLEDMLAAPRNEYPAFPAALSFAMLLEPEQVTRILSQRLEAVHDRLAELDAQLQDERHRLLRIGLIETEYQRAVTDTEARWLESVIDDINSGRLSWDYDQIGPQADHDYSQATERSGRQSGLSMTNRGHTSAWPECSAGRMAVRRERSTVQRPRSVWKGDRKGHGRICRWRPVTCCGSSGPSDPHPDVCFYDDHESSVQVSSEAVRLSPPPACDGPLTADPALAPAQRRL